MAKSNRLWQAVLIVTVTSAISPSLSAQTRFAITATAEDTGYVAHGKGEIENATVELAQSARNKTNQEAQGKCEAEAKRRGFVESAWELTARSALLRPGRARRFSLLLLKIPLATGLTPAYALRVITLGNNPRRTFWGGGFQC